MNKIGRITGLDPAGPNFYDKPSNGRLSVASAALVDSIHTDGDSDGLHYGIGKVIGHVDFFPNGAKKQPGCPTAVANVTVVETPGVDTRGSKLQLLKGFHLHLRQTMKSDAHVCLSV